MPSVRFGALARSTMPLAPSPVGYNYGRVCDLHDQANVEVGVAGVLRPTRTRRLNGSTAATVTVRVASKGV